MASFHNSTLNSWRDSYRSVVFRLIIPVPIAIVLAVAAAWVILPRVIEANSIAEAVRAGQQVVDQFKIIRAYYTANVAAKVSQSGVLKASISHKDKPDSIPLPATMIHDLSELLAKKDTTISLYSKYPFPNRKDRTLDIFQQEAWDALVTNPNGTLSRSEFKDGKRVVRVAVADTMAVQACVGCHNSIAGSPKTDWKLGDVRGVLEVTTVIDGPLAAGARMNTSIVMAIIVAGILMIVIAVVAARSVTRPLHELIALLKRMARGEDVEITCIDRADEIGDTGRAVNEIKIMLAERARIEAETKAEQDRAALADKAERDRLAAEENAAAEKRAAEERAAAEARVMNELGAAVGGIANAAMAGDFSHRVPLDGKQGAVRDLAKSMNIMCETMGGVMDDIAAMLGAMADGDLTRRIFADYQGTFGALKDSANTTAEKLSQTVAEIKATAREVANASGEISVSTTDLSQRTEEQAASLEETSAAMEQIAATVKHNAEIAQQANASASSTREVADRGGQVVAKAVDAMAKIEESSRKISDIIGVIDEIARQTNLLALNAAVEAARAGDAGRGFAVVASEVRSLAQRSSQAAKDIKDLITNSNGQVKDGVDLVNRAGAALSEIVESIKKVADGVADIANASTEQSGGIEQVNKALTQMDEVTQQNSALVEENAATAKTLEGQAGAMNERVAIFRLNETDAPSIAPAQQADKAAAKPAAKAPAKPAAPARPAAKAPAAASRGPVGAMHSKLATALKHDPDWEEF